MTLLRVVAGLVLALILGVPVGILMGLNRRAEAVLDVWVMVGLTVPSLCYAIVAFIWFGLNEGAAIIAIAVTAAPSITINIWEGVKNIDTKLVAMARVFEASRSAIVRRVLLPQIFPYVMASARFGLGIIWKITVLVELIGRPNGVGFKLFYWYQLADMRQVLAWTLLFTIIMLMIELAHTEADRKACLRLAPTGGGMNPVIEVALASKDFQGPRRHVPCRAEGSRSDGRRGGVPVHPRPLGLRQINFAQRARRAGQGLRGPGERKRRPRRLLVSGAPLAPVAYGGRKSRFCARQLPGADLALERAEIPLSRHDRLVGISRLLSPPDSRAAWPSASHCAGSVRGARHPPDGRAVLGAR